MDLWPASNEAGFFVARSSHFRGNTRLFYIFYFMTSLCS